MRSKSPRAALNWRVAGSGSRHISSPPGSRNRWNTRIPASNTRRISGASDSTSASKIVRPTISSASPVISAFTSTTAPFRQRADVRSAAATIASP